jgi:hypothetical protein
MHWMSAVFVVLMLVPVRGGCSCLMESPVTGGDSTVSDGDSTVFDGGSSACVPDCAADQECVENHCVTLCADPCSPSATTCEANQVMSCVQNAAGCYEVVVGQTCGVHQTCTSGQCLCESTCTPGEVTCGASGGLVPCLGPDGDGCTYPGPEAPCENGLVCSQSYSACMPDTPEACFAINECQFDGQITCYGPADPVKYRECSVNPDGCLAWDCTT